MESLCGRYTGTDERASFTVFVHALERSSSLKMSQSTKAMLYLEYAVSERSRNTKRAYEELKTFTAMDTNACTMIIIGLSVSFRRSNSDFIFDSFTNKGRLSS